MAKMSASEKDSRTKSTHSDWVITISAFISRGLDQLDTLPGDMNHLVKQKTPLVYVTLIDINPKAIEPKSN